jgi:hypothetical protein
MQSYLYPAIVAIGASVCATVIVLCFLDAVHEIHEIVARRKRE